LNKSQEIIKGLSEGGEVLTFDGITSVDSRGYRTLRYVPTGQNGPEYYPVMVSTRVPDDVVDAIVKMLRGRMQAD
jgi:hypothetical protein